MSWTLWVSLTLGAAPAGPTLTLEQALQNADSNQPNLRVARAQVNAAEARGDEVRAGMLPQLNANAAFGKVWGSGVANAGHSSGLSVGATASQLLWDFGQTWNRYRAQQAAIDAQRATAESTYQLVQLSVRTAFFSARAEKSLVKVAEETLANQELHLRQVQGFVRVGTRPEIDLAQAKTDRANARVQLIQAQNGYATAKARLNQAMGVEGSSDYQVADVTLATVPGETKPLEVLLKEALQARPEYLALDRQVQVTTLTLASVRGAYLPSVGVSASATDYPGAASGNAWNAFAQVGLTWSLFSGLSTHSLVRETRALGVVAQAQVDLERQQIRFELEQAQLAVMAANEALSASDEALVNARERLRLAEGRYQTGVGNVIELGDSQVALTNAGAQRVQAEYNLASARAQLLKALGRRA